MEFKTEELRAYVVTGVIKSGGYPSVAHAAGLAFDALVADANRYRDFRAVACETDEDKQHAMHVAMDAVEKPDLEKPTAETYDAVFDAWIAAAKGALK